MSKRPTCMGFCAAIGCSESSLDRRSRKKKYFVRASRYCSYKVPNSLKNKINNHKAYKNSRIRRTRQFRISVIPSAHFAAPTCCRCRTGQVDGWQNSRFLSIRTKWQILNLIDSKIWLVKKVIHKNQILTVACVGAFLADNSEFCDRRHRM